MLPFLRTRGETVETIIKKAQQEEWHAGTQRARYEYYKAGILRVHRNIQERDLALRRLRVIFGLEKPNNDLL